MSTMLVYLHLGCGDGSGNYMRFEDHTQSDQAQVHPGGRRSLMQSAGGDCTESYKLLAFALD